MKEEKNILNLYLSKIAKGDKSCVSKLTKRLADRLLFLPVLSQKSERQSEPATTTINVYRHERGEQDVIPVFTTEKNFNNWKVSASVSVESVSLLGADLCAALGEESWISVDEGCDHEAVIEPAVVLKIATEPMEEIDPFDEPLVTQAVAAPQVEAEPSVTDTGAIYLSAQQIIQEEEAQKEAEPASTSQSKLQDW